MNHLAAAAGADDGHSPILHVIRKTDVYYNLVNRTCVDQVICDVMRLCLEYAVNNRHVYPNGRIYIHKHDNPVKWSERVGETIKEFFLKSAITLSNEWYKKNIKKFQTHYMELDTTNLMEIMTRVTDIRQDSNDIGMKILWQHLRALKEIRNGVIHEKNYAQSKDVVSLVQQEVIKIIHHLERLFFINSHIINTMKINLKKNINEITCSEQTDEDKLASVVEHFIIKENDEMWKPLIMSSMKYEKLLFDLNILLSDVFHEICFEVISVHFYGCTYLSSIHETIVCSDILSTKSCSNCCIEIIEGEPGSGKTTFLKMMTVEFCKQKVDSIFKSICNFSMMIFINCEENDNIGSLWQYLKTHYRKTVQKFTKELVIETLKNTKMIIAIDGLDQATESTIALVEDVIHSFEGSETVKILITSRPGFFKLVLKHAFHIPGNRYRLLNVMAIEKVKDQEKYITRFINEMPTLNYKDIMTIFKVKQNELDSHFRRPLGLNHFVTICHKFPDELQKLTNDQSLFNLTYHWVVQNMSERIPETIDNPAQCSRLIMKITGRHCLQMIQNSTYKFDQEFYSKLTNSCYEINQNIPVGLLSSVIEKRPRAKSIFSNESQLFKFSYHSMQEYLASKMLTEKLLEEYSSSNITPDAAPGKSLVRILRSLTSEPVVEKDLVR